MAYDSTKHNRRSIRKKGYDYSQAGAYFVTVCTQNRQPILTDPVVAGIIKDVWFALPNWFPTIGLDEFVIMPNHVHFVLWLQVDPEGGSQEFDERMGTPSVSGDREGTSPQKPKDWVIPTPEKTNDLPHLGEVIGAWKSLVTNVYLDWIKQHDPSRRAKFWQRNYYDRIVRNDRALSAFRRYIHDNPKNWSLDPDNSANALKLPFPETIGDYLDDVRRHVNNHKHIRPS